MRSNFYDYNVFTLSAAGERPIRLETRPKLTSQIGRVIGAIVCFVAAGMLESTKAMMPAGGYEFVWKNGPFGLLLIGIGIVVSAILTHWRRSAIEISDEEVAVIERGFLRGKRWSEPLTSYKGVRWQQLRPRRQSSSLTDGPNWIHVVALAHPDERRSVPLHVEVTTGEGPRQEWENFARLIGLPAIDARGSEVRVRAAEDVDKSVRELAREGKIETTWDDRPAPEKIEVEHLGETSDETGQRIRLTLQEQPIPAIIAYPVYAGLGLFAVLSLATLKFGVFVMLIFLGVCIRFFNDRGAKQPPRLTLSPRELSYEGGTGDQRNFTLSLDAIEGVRIDRTEIGPIGGHTLRLPGGAVVLESDLGERPIGSSLPDEALIYLRDMIESTIARAA